MKIFWWLKMLAYICTQITTTKKLNTMTTTVKTNEVLKLEKQIFILNDRINNTSDIISINIWTAKLNFIIGKLNNLS